VLIRPSERFSLSHLNTPVAHVENSPITFLTSLPGPYSPFFSAWPTQWIFTPLAPSSTASPVSFSLRLVNGMFVEIGTHSNLPSASVVASFVQPLLLYLLGDLATHCP